MDKLKPAIKGKTVEKLCTKKSTGCYHKSVKQHVDYVDKLFAQEVFAYFYDISSTHSYQQITVDTIFQ